jgi:predicted RNA-binding Zn-ribbon protein involved in translation (DUF1610 family)
VTGKRRRARAAAARLTLDTDLAEPAPLPDGATLAQLPEPVRACPRCGSYAIRPLRLQERAELLDSVACPRCGYEGRPVVFDRSAEYGAFLEELARVRAGASR